MSSISGSRRAFKKQLMLRLLAICGFASALGSSSLAQDSGLANVVDTTSNLLRINYAAIDSHVHEFYLYEGAWQDFDLKAHAGGPI
ncbi:MAG: hypothetical protein JO210_14170 [Acidobacteriaceae bacterium]|nr:hypothetical protein [Acidobacteriaceae bacterium]